MEKSAINHIYEEIKRRYPNEITKDLAADLGLTVNKVYYIADKLRVKKSQEFLNNWELSGRGRIDRQSTRLNSSHVALSRMPSSA